MPRRKSPNRAFEAEIGIGALRIMADQPNGVATTSLLKEMMPEYVELSDADLTESETRPGESIYKQIVGNIVSHRDDMEGNIIHDGYAEYLGKREGLRITEAGRALLKSKGH